MSNHILKLKWMNIQNILKNANLTLKKLNDDNFVIQNNNIKTDLTKNG